MKGSFGKIGWSNRIAAFFIAAALVLSCLPTAGLQVQAKEGDDDSSQAADVYDLSFDEGEITNDVPRRLDFGLTSDQTKRGQTFIADQGGDLTSVEVSLWKTDGASDLTADLYLCDFDTGIPQGDPLETVTVAADTIAAGVNVKVSIPFTYQGLEKGKKYLVMLGQEELKNIGYKWSISADTAASNWWSDSYTGNPQTPQKDKAGAEQHSGDELQNIQWDNRNNGNKYIDKSAIGDFWMKVNYTYAKSATLIDPTKEYIYDISFDAEGARDMDFARMNDQVKRGQTFVAVRGGEIKSVTVMVKNVGGNDELGNIVAELYECETEGIPKTQDPLAVGTADKSGVGSTFGEVNIPMASEDGGAVHLTKGQMYIVLLGADAGVTTAGGYKWCVSADKNDAYWWQSDKWNPQVKQLGYDGELPSMKYDGSSYIDESRCGDFWMKVAYVKPEGEGENPNPPVEDKPVEVVEPKGLDLKQRYEKDMEEGGESFYMDRILTRPGVDPSLTEDSGLMTRGSALYVKGKNTDGLIREFGFDGIMRYVKGDQAGYKITVNGQSANQFLEKTAWRADRPSHWSSKYTGKDGSANEGLAVNVKRFITDQNVAVTILEMENKTDADKTVKLAIPRPAGYKALEDDANTLGRTIRVDYRNFKTKLSMENGTVTDDGLEATVSVPAGETVSWKAQMGFVDARREASAEEYEAYCGYSAQEAFRTHVQAYNRWWVDNIPYVEVSDEEINKMIAYRWWIARFNMADIGSYYYPYPTSMEGVFGYNNAIINAVPWQLDEMRYLRSPLNAYSTWADVMYVSKGGAFRDNPAGLWGNMPQQYISQATWENYKVHGGQTALLEKMAEAGAGDVDGTQKKYDADGDYLYDIQYDAWDADTASLAVSGAQNRIDTASWTWANATAVSEMYAAVGNTAAAEKYQEFADKVKEKNIEELWDAASGQFLMKMKATGEFNPYRDINNYYCYLVGMVPTTGEYNSALDVWGDENEFPARPMYISNSKDYLYIQANQDKGLASRSRNYSPGAMGVTLDLYASIIRNYGSDTVDAAAFYDLLKYYTETCYVKGNVKYPDTNEFFSGDGANHQPTYRSWIHHNWHSQYNTLVIEHLFGITPREDDIIELDPIDVGMDSFTIKNISYHGKNIDVIWDGTSYQLFVDGDQVAAVNKLCHFTWDSKSGQVEILDESGAQATTETGKALPKATEVTYTTGREGDIIQEVSTYDIQSGKELVSKDEAEIKPIVTPEHTGTYKIESQNDFSSPRTLGFGTSYGDEYKRSQSFVSTKDCTVTGIQVQIKQKTQGSGHNGDVTVELRKADANGFPILNDTPLATTTISGDSFDELGEFKLVTALFEEGCELTKDTLYYIALGKAEDNDGYAYDWMSSSDQAIQDGVDNSAAMLKLVKIRGTRANGETEIADESRLGDHYLEVFYTTEKQDLSEAIQAAEDLKKKGYPESASAAAIQQFEAALEEVKGVLAKEDATAAELKAAKEKLQNAMNALNEAPDTEVETQKKELGSAIQAAEELKKNGYPTNASAAAIQQFEAALEEVKGVLAKEDVTAAELKAAKEKLQNAMNALNEAPDTEVETQKKELGSAIQAAEELKKNGYPTNASAAAIQQFEAALEEVKGVLAKEDVTAAELKAAKEKLQAAIDGLNKAPAPDTEVEAQKKELNSSVQAAEDLKKKGYPTNASAAAIQQFEAALEEVKGILAKENPTAAELKAAKEKLQAAMEALNKAPAPNPPKPVTVSKIKISGISNKIAAGKKIQLTAKVSPSNAANKAVTWKSSNTKVATVNSKGVVTMNKKSGGKKVTITATAKDTGKVKATYKITSMKGKVKKVAISGKTTVKAGKTLKLTAKVSAEKGANKKVKWSSSNTKYATVSSSGKVQAKKAGKNKKVKITAMATDGTGKKKTVTIKIK